MRVYGSCSRYVQGYGALGKLGEYAGWMGKRFLVLASKGRLRDLKDVLIAAMGEERLVFSQFDGECSWAAINTLLSVCEQSEIDVVVGLGAGKIADTATVVANKSGKRLVIAPTTAATDAFVSASALIYPEEGGVHSEVLRYPKNPDLVLVDTKVIANAPLRLFVAGMGDALSTYVGGKACQDHGFPNHFGGRGTQTGVAVAKLSYDLLMEYGRQAKRAIEQKVVTDAVEKIIEVNILMSGMGFENNGSSADHCFLFGIEALAHRGLDIQHGEGVAFSSCCQMVMQGASTRELDEIFRFCRDVGLPVTFADMGLTDLTEEEFTVMVNKVLSIRFVKNLPYEATYETVYGAYKATDAIGAMYKAGKSLL